MADMPLKSITSKVFYSLYTKRLVEIQETNRGSSGASLKAHCRGSLKRFFDKHVKEGNIDVNPITELVNDKKIRLKTSVRMDLLKRVHLQSVIEHVEGLQCSDMKKRFFHCLLFTGLRVGELGKIKTDAVHGGLYDGFIKLSDTKTVAFAELPLNNQAAALIQEQINEDKRQNGFVFEHSTGTPANSSTLQGVYSSINKHFNTNIHNHALRKFFVGIGRMVELNLYHVDVDRLTLHSSHNESVTDRAYNIDNTENLRHTTNVIGMEIQKLIETLDPKNLQLPPTNKKSLVPFDKAEQFVKAQVGINAFKRIENKTFSRLQTNHQRKLIAEISELVEQIQQHELKQQLVKKLSELKA